MVTDKDTADQSWTKTKIRNFLASLSEKEKVNLADWLNELIELRDSPSSHKQKLHDLAKILRNSKPLLPVVKQLSKEAKRTIWVERKGGFRAFIAGSAFAILLFGFQGAGIAAFGGAIGLPLWIVFGGGSTLAYALLAELQNKD